MTTNGVAGQSRRGRQSFCRSPAVDAAAAAGLTCLSALAGLAQEQETPADIIAAQIRSQGYACAQPVTATRDSQASMPLGAVWTLRCGNARYRVRLVPDMAAEVTQIE